MAQMTPSQYNAWVRQQEQKQRDAIRWRGALFALNPANTDAARHFCTSVREIFTEILDRWAENEAVIAADADCEKTQQGTPSRRAKIRFLLKLKGADSPEMLGFVEKDIEDILQLFPVFNKATHGVAGTLTFASLQSLRRRVEGGIMFLATIACHQPQAASGPSRA